MKPKAYIETTIIGYLTARPSRDLIVAAHQQVTQEWWEKRRGSFDLYISQLVIQEAGAGDKQVAQQRLQVMEGLPLFELRQDAVALVRALVEKGVLPRKAAEDALHIPVATVHGMDYVLTWSLQHLANAAMRNAIIAACRCRAMGHR